MRSIDFTGWMLLLSGWLAWTMDGYDVSRDFRLEKRPVRSLLLVADENALGWDE
jgi:hypothetical protein